MLPDRRLADGPSALGPASVRLEWVVRALDVACGSWFFTRHLRGFVVGVDQSSAMVAIAQSRLPGEVAIIGDAFDLVTPDRTFHRIFTARFYGHPAPVERQMFLAEARRVAGESGLGGLRPTTWCRFRRGAGSVLDDGSRHRL